MSVCSICNEYDHRRKKCGCCGAWRLQQPLAGDRLTRTGSSEMTLKDAGFAAVYRRMADASDESPLEREEDDGGGGCFITSGVMLSQP